MTGLRCRLIRNFPADRRYWKVKRRILLLTGLLALLLTGCFFQSPEDLWTLPKLSDDQSNLQSKLDEVLATGLTTTAPISGAQTVQLQDLDGDGVDEAVAFFRDNSAGAERPLKIYLFRQNQEGLYETAAVIEGEGNAIQSIAFEQLNEGAVKELVVSWQLSSNVYTLTVYSIEQYNVMELLRSSYTRFTVQDMDQDNIKEVVLLHLDASGEIGSRAELYEYTGGTMTRTSSAYLSRSMTSVLQVRYGYLKGTMPALFLTGAYSGTDTVRVTDILAMRDGVLTNITLDQETWDSTGTTRTYLASPQDINGDSVLEIPMPRSLLSYDNNSIADSQWIIDWQQYDILGNAASVCITYHNNQDVWYLTLPEHWVDQLTITRKDTIYGERTVIFSRTRGEDQPPEAFLVLYTLTGDNRAIRSQIGNRQVLLTTSDTIYAAEFLDSSWDCGVDMDALRLERFHLITTEWSTQE